MDKDIPGFILAQIITDWIREFGPTQPLYGKETVRNDISGSVRPLLASTEIPPIKILSERTGFSKRILQRIMDGDTEFVTYDMADKLLTQMDKNDCWYVELIDFA